MPIYEFYCRPCHTIYSFFVRRSGQEIAPACPKCGAVRLDKQVSRFAISKGMKEPTAAEQDPMAHVDDATMEKLMMEMSATFGDDDQAGDENPQQMAAMMRKIFSATGMEPTSAMAEAMRRMDAGEDPDKIDEEMGAQLDAEEPLFGGQSGMKGRLRRLVEPPNIDPGLYDP